MRSIPAVGITSIAYALGRVPQDPRTGMQTYPAARESPANGNFSGIFRLS